MQVESGERIFGLGQNRVKPKQFGCTLVVYLNFNNFDSKDLTRFCPEFDPNQKYFHLTRQSPSRQISNPTQS